MNRLLKTVPRRIAQFLLAACALALPLHAQQQVQVDIFGNQAVSTIKLAYPFPNLGAGINHDVVDTAFHRTLLKDLAYAEIFTLVALPPAPSVSLETAQRAGAQALLQIDMHIEGTEHVIDVRLYDVAGKAIQMGRRYRGTEAALPTIAHTIANEMVLYFNGKPGVFLSQITFTSDRGGTRDVWVMDYDGSNQRKITALNALTLTPRWSPDGERIVYTSFARGTSDIYISLRRGGGRVHLKTGLNLNVSPSFSPDGTQIVFVGSVAGNPDIYVMNDDGKNIRRLTSQSSIESTPSWSPNGREIAFTSSRNGTPQIYMMDAEGSNVRRISFDGDWNDDAVFSPNGEFLAYTSRVSGRFQIRLMNVASGQSKILAGEGSNEQPRWAPDGRSVAFMSNRSGRWQLYRIGLDGRGFVQLTSEGNNMSPDWSQNIK